MEELQMGFVANNHMEIVDIINGKSSVLKAYLDETSMNPYGMAHGGFIFGLGDTAMGVVSRTTGRKSVTLSANISYLRPSVGKYLTAKAEMIKDGKKTSYLRTNIYDENDKLVATMDANYCYID